jgi:hypothetical protein
LDALYQSSAARLRQADERIQQARRQLLLSRLLLLDLRTHLRELHAWDRQWGPHET